jgi:hypothetical protein
MQTQSPPPINRLHWIPVEPSWLVSVCIVILAVLPHQIPRTLTRGLQSNLGGLLFAAVSIFIFWLKPVLGTALLLLLAAIRSASYLEGFVAMPTITKDPVEKSKRQKWLVEEVMDEDPSGIQERTEGPGILYDAVKQNHRWGSEEALDEHPEGIQDRPVGSSPIEETSRPSSSYMSHSHR